MSIQPIVTIALAAATLASIGCLETDRKSDKPIDVVPANEPVLTSTLTSTKKAVAPAALPDPELEPKEVVELPKAGREELEAPSALAERITESIDGVTLQRFLTTSDIEKREPVDLTSTFGPEHDRVFAFVDVSNESELDKSLFVHFIGPNGKVSGGIELEIPASVPRWRTWAYTRHFDAPGTWRVEIRDAEGSLLGTLPFEVDAAF